jgi:glycosidase
MKEEQSRRIRLALALLAVLACWHLPAAAAGAPGFRDRLPQDEVIYFVIPDRFRNGDPSNDRGGLVGEPRVTGFDPASPAFFHGGDLRGLRERLDYIQGLGATAIWVTPVFRNKAVQERGPYLGSGFHGYWILDFTAVDPHLGTEDDFRQFVDAAHARGMKVILDIVVNHTADVIRYRECPDIECPYRSHGDYPGKAYTPFLPAGEEHAKKPEWLNDPAWYHNRGDSTFEGESSTFGDFAGLDDVDTENPRVVQGFIEIYGNWIDRFGIDGYRIDTAKHVNPEFWQAFLPAILARARARGIPNFHIFGEVATQDVDPALQAQHTRVDGFPAVLDFSFSAAMREALSGGGSRVLSRVFDADSLYEGGAQGALGLPTFLGNHDDGRFAYRLKKLHPEYTGEQILARVELAHAMLLTLRGVPVLYYGDEQGLVGTGNDNASRQDLFPSQVPAFRTEARLGPPHDPDADSLDPSHPLYRQIAALARVRAAEPALRRGRQVLRADSKLPGLFAVSRFDPASGREVVLAFNTSEQPVDMRIEVSPRSRAFEALSGSCAQAVVEPASYRIVLAPLAWAVCAARP